jgi:hypothetical protein
MQSDQEEPWEGRCTSEAWAFTRKCAELNKSNPHPTVTLDFVINTLMTELWDNGFSKRWEGT